MTGEPALDLRGVAKLYGFTAALKATTLRVEEGETVALLGPNGSGKTTMLKIVAGAIAPTLGAGTIFGHDLVSERRLLRREVGLLASETYLYDDLSAIENLRFLATMAGVKTDAGQFTRALSEVGLLDHREERVRGFSSGMKRRLSLARLVLLRPRLLLLDEPYNSLDEAGARLVDSIIAGVAESGGAIVLATHDTERALACAQRVVTLERGSVTYSGTVASYRGRYAPVC